MVVMRNISRRHFLTGTAAACAAGLTLTTREQHTTENSLVRAKGAGVAYDHEYESMYRNGDIWFDTSKDAMHLG